MRLGVVLLAGIALLGAAHGAVAGPRVVADIAPVAALVADVMGGDEDVTTLVRPGASPHGYALRPSEAAALQEAELVIYVGEALTPWLPSALGSLAQDARKLALLSHPGTLKLDTRENALFAAETDDHDHDHGDTDPHAWLDPENARRWIALIAGYLSAIDPDGAETYAANAEAAVAEISRAEAEAAARLEPVRDQPFIVFHDAYQYFETRFGLASAGAVALSDAAAPGPARLKTLQAHITGRGVRCGFAEPQFNAGLLQTVLSGTGARIAYLDPVGADLPPGAGFYPALLRDLSTRIAECLG
ncbi:zinc ABC transporter substrate-binding protein [Poseidonocella sedimentorum]|uniref:High-affinity zinc uptake system protein ZnuA n=1 Tax=Poseidonocella sedimentorum TaxID=871652 RepID=A0A1I6D324_9RHOB|nr:zinc ABC transporter substrate-binding protein [Poseidonocella sedimentorum]SFQ99751.1 zinc transport system substrate-binding protein [Poseidonocella sedimentorum]